MFLFHLNAQMYMFNVSQCAVSVAALALSSHQGWAAERVVTGDLYRQSHSDASRLERCQVLLL